MQNRVINTGTTIMAVEFNEGVVIGADSFTSCEVDSGTYVINRIADKLTQVAENIFCCRSGICAFTQFEANSVAEEISMLEKEFGHPVSVKIAAYLFKRKAYKRNMGSFIVAGWDKSLGGQAYHITSNGVMMRQPVIFAGSGSECLSPFVDFQYDKLMKSSVIHEIAGSSSQPTPPKVEKVTLNQEDTVNLVKESLTLAMRYDTHSGGVMRIGVLNKDGCIINTHKLNSA